MPGHDQELSPDSTALDAPAEAGAGAPDGPHADPGARAHTPGPWKRYKGAIHPVLEFGGSGNAGFAICGEFYGPQAPFNMRLIAAAPEMFAALELLEARAATGDLGPLLRKEISAARRALMRARGETPTAEQA